MTLFDSEIIKGAVFSRCRRYRYSLHRTWDAGDDRYVNFIGLNPSTADEDLDDPTIKKCMKFALSWGYGGIVMTNIFAWRDTSPAEMKKAVEPIGEVNDRCLISIARDASLVIAAWSQHGSFKNRSQDVRKLLNNFPLHILKMGASEPWHPLYLKDSTQPIIWQPARERIAA
jgi:hypothetical protein